MDKFTQPLYASIDMAIVSIWAECSGDVSDKLKIIEENADNGFKMELPILSFPETLIVRDGYLASKILKYLKQKTGELWFIFGAFYNQNGKRCYVVLPGEKVPKLFAISRWEIIEWTGRRIHQI